LTGAVLDLREPDRAELVEVNRTTLRLWHWGDERAPAVILVHGGYDHGRMFDDFAPRVAALGYHAVAVDMRGHGDSGPLAHGNAWSSMMLDLGALAQLLGPPVGLIGHSMGGGQALCAGGAFPDLVRWVVVLDGMGPPAAAFANEADVVAVSQRGVEMVERALQPTTREWSSLDEMAARRRTTNPRLTEGWSLHLARHGSKPGPGGGLLWKADRMFTVGFPAAFDLESLLAEYSHVRVPVLVLSGTEPDTWRDLTDAERDERLAVMPDARHHDIPGTGHYVHLEDPHTVVARIAEFVSEVDRR
jgi:pimeloyl-ACP methyl ester carboxylesterase